MFAFTSVVSRLLLVITSRLGPGVGALCPGPSWRECWVRAMSALVTVRVYVPRSVDGPGLLLSAVEAVPLFFAGVDELVLFEPHPSIAADAAAIATPMVRRVSILTFLRVEFPLRRAFETLLRARYETANGRLERRRGRW
jgi:hypothetical protein